MYSYPLKFKSAETPADDDLTILDAEKNPILFRHKITEAIESGNEACVIYTDKTSGQPIYNALRQKKDDVESILIRTPGNDNLGIIYSEKGHKWRILDARGNLVATIQEKAAWKNSCLFTLLTLPLDDESFWFKLIAPRRFFVRINDKTVAALREVVSDIHDDFNLKKKGEYTENQEALILVSLMMIL